MQSALAWAATVQAKQQRNLKCEVCEELTARRVRILGPGSESIICDECERENTARCGRCRRRWFDNHIIEGLCPACR